MPELAIYSFATGERFETNFLIFVRNKQMEGSLTYQGYVEPKSSHLLEEDAWKEQFSLQIEDEHTIKIIGFLFFNQENRMAEFEETIDDWIDKL